MKTGGCAKRSLRPRTGTWFRALNLRHWKTRLSTDHSRISRSRFSDASAAAPLYRILYLGENHQVAIYEVGARLGNPNAPLSRPRGFRRALALREGAFADDDPDTAEVLEHLAALLCQSGRGREARAIGDRARAMRGRLGQQPIVSLRRTEP
jgi:hypothetical protein